MPELAGADDIAIRRCQWHGAQAALLVATKGTPPEPAIVGRLRHAWDLRAALAPGWAAIPLDFSANADGAQLVLADPGGALLDTLAGQPWKPQRFVRAALALAHAVGAMHAAGVLHRDLKPAYLLLDEAAGRAWITGFRASAWGWRWWPQWRGCMALEDNHPGLVARLFVKAPPRN